MSIVKHIPTSVLIEQGIDFNVGDIFINHSQYSRLIRIESIYEHERDKSFYITYKEALDWTYQTWSEKASYMSVAEFLKRGYVRLEKDSNLDDYVGEAIAIINGEKSISDYADASTDNIGSETALVSSSSKTSLIALQGELEIKKHKAELIRQFIGLEIEKRKAEMQKVMSELDGVLTEFRQKITKIMKVITTIELYLGINEELFQIQDGQKASADTPITFRQQVLYMDEEIGHWENGGLDFTNIDWFDEWLIKDNNFNNIAPEEKCLVVFRPRRYDKDYGDRYSNAALNHENKSRTYLLIRNGKCLYRIYTQNIVILPRLFPRREELVRIMDALNNDSQSNFSEKRNKEEADNALFEYKKRAILMQGLIDRSNVFHPLPADKINIFDLDGLGDKVRFIYDDEATLPSGRLSFDDWRKSINSKIVKGSRIMVVDSYDDYQIKRRTFIHSNYGLPSPNIGVYEVEEFEREFTQSFRLTSDERLSNKYLDEFKAKYPRHRIKEAYTYEVTYAYFEDAEYTPKLTILHNPKDTVYGGWGEFKMEERKKRIRFTIYQTDKQILNYDQMSLDDIEFYINSRVDRPNYLHMMPILIRIREQRLKELAQEKEFVKLVLAQNAGNKTATQLELLEAKIWELIKWWKEKNMWKRSLDKDDVKAFRMISKQLSLQK